MHERIGTIVVKTYGLYGINYTGGPHFVPYTSMLESKLSNFPYYVCTIKQLIT